MPKVDLWLDVEDIADAQSGSSFVLEIPKDANARGNFKDPADDKAKANWVQRFEIVESKMYDDISKDKEGNEYPAVCVEVKFQIPSDALRPKTGEPDVNAGRTVTAWYRIVKAALGHREHPKYKANNFNNGKAMSILRGIWGSETFPQGQKANLGEYFSAEGTQAPPVVGNFVVANVKNSKYEGEPRTELTDFVPAELIEA